VRWRGGRDREWEEGMERGREESSARDPRTTVHHPYHRDESKLRWRERKGDREIERSYEKLWEFAKLTDSS